MKTKICGIAREEDAALAESLGADFVGAVMAPESKRSVSAQKARSILSSVSVAGVVVTTYASLGELEGIVKDVAPSFIQLHSDVPLEVVRELSGKVKLVKTLRVGGRKKESGEGEGELKHYSELMGRYAEFVEYFLLDGEKGGSGKTLDWELCAQIVREAPKPVFLAGGLNPENVREALGIVKPFGVDVASGVEESVGIKSAKKVKMFIEAAKNE
jgi:phosphoribosylanthranilate isomerase